MTDSIPDLWSDDIQVKVLAPAAILRAQVSSLRRKTQGLVEAVVDTRTSAESIRHHLDLIAPAVNGYRERILTATHSTKKVYPVTVTAECFATREKGRLQLLSARKILDGLQPNERTAITQEAFIGLVKEVLQSPEVRGAIESLIAQSNEAMTSSSVSSAESVPVEPAGPPSGEHDA
jgi:hypothetical protein